MGRYTNLFPNQRAPEPSAETAKPREGGGRRDPTLEGQISVRVSEATKQQFKDATNKGGMEHSQAARQIIELVVEHIRAGFDWIDTLHAIKTALQTARPASAPAPEESKVGAQG